MLTDLADACRKSGLRVVELPDWRTNTRPGTFNPSGVLCHHTGGSSDTRAYAEWMAYTGRDDLPAPLCQLALDRAGNVYICAAGRANHAGKAKASGPMPAGDGNALYIGIEAMNTGSEGWTPVQRDAYQRLCAALCEHYGWPASHVRAHRETSITGKWDPGLLDMDQHRIAITALLEDDMPLSDADVNRVADAVLARVLKSADGNSVGRVLGFLFHGNRAILAELAQSPNEDVRAAVKEALADAVVSVDVNVNQNGA